MTNKIFSPSAIQQAKDQQKLLHGVVIFIVTVKIRFVPSQTVKRPISKFQRYKHFAKTIPKSSFSKLLGRPLLLNAYKSNV